MPMYAKLHKDFFKLKISILHTMFMIMVSPPPVTHKIFSLLL